jgi:hypothetical protein
MAEILVNSVDQLIPKTIVDKNRASYNTIGRKTSPIFQKGEIYQSEN